MTKLIHVFFAKKSFGYSIWANIDGKSPKAFVHAKNLETGLKNIKLQLTDALGGEWDPVDGTIETLYKQEMSGALDELATEWVEREIGAA